MRTLSPCRRTVNRERVVLRGWVVVDGRLLKWVGIIAGCVAAPLGAVALYAAPTPSDAAAAKRQWAAIEDAFQARVKPFLVQHCYHCHGNGKHKGDLTLDRFTTLASVQDDEQTWKHVGEMLRQKLMPPDTKPQPSPEEVARVTGWIGEALAYCDCSGERDPGHPVRRRPGGQRPCAESGVRQGHRGFVLGAVIAR